MNQQTSDLVDRVAAAARLKAEGKDGAFMATIHEAIQRFDAERRRDEPAWVSLTPAYIRFISQRKYEALSPAARRWYAPLQPEPQKLEYDQIMAIADRCGHRWKSPDEEGISFEKSAFFSFVEELLETALNDR